MDPQKTGPREGSERMNSWFAGIRDLVFRHDFFNGRAVSILFIWVLITAKEFSFSFTGNEMDVLTLSLPESPESLA